MIARRVILSPAAERDLNGIYRWVATGAGPSTALAYVFRIERYLTNLDLGSERGTSRDDVRAGLRIVGFERSLTIAFIAEEQHVTVLRIFRRGRNWTRKALPRITDQSS
jgi:toxin ParE1/3/4